MSGQPYWQYNCKNFYTHNCNNKVWQQGTACAECVASGRDSSENIGINSLRPSSRAIIPMVGSTSNEYWTYPCLNFWIIPPCLNQNLLNRTYCPACIADGRDGARGCSSVSFCSDTQQNSIEHPRLDVFGEHSTHQLGNTVTLSL